MPTFLAPDQVTLHYDTRGAGRTRVLLAGGAARHPEYLGDLAGLSGHHVIPHQRGVGHSPGPGLPYWDLASDVEALRTHLGLSHLTIVAHSAGTRLAMAYAARYPDQISAMLLITPPSAHLVDAESDIEELRAARRGDPVFDDALAAMVAGPDLTDDEAFTAWHLASAPVTYAAWTAVEQEHARVGRQHLAAARAFFDGEPPADLAERLSAVRAPVRIVGGAQDCTTGVAPVAALADLFPAGEVVVLEECGHYPWVEQPELFREVAEEFLYRV
ncbi:alpha/beta fold hydrolase [Actinophytocola gossypii]|uniref:Alpha/beta hydrolase n=1 Tax=Actinophytocola gossypii TaxID=2812003 RepID=A0ABT2JG49_9PSEU|nr:alpha/beta hydrolase [Actinophytocola gossypii]MCT2586847.1 alpha/beta hydrolase [Actinophytocola gossypii]